MKPSFIVLRKNHYSSNELNRDFVDGKDVYKEIGYDIDALMKQNPGYENTCAVRMSLALIKASVRFNGRLQIKLGSYKGRTLSQALSYWQIN